jgi:DNA-directed RNA polymerase specialized sigma subunit
MPRVANYLIHASGSLTKLAQELETRKRFLSDDEVKSLALLAYEVSQLRDNCIRRLRAEGKTHEEIAKLFKISASRVCQINASK